MRTDICMDMRIDVRIDACVDIRMGMYTYMCIDKLKFVKLGIEAHAVH